MPEGRKGITISPSVTSRQLPINGWSKVNEKCGKNEKKLLVPLILFLSITIAFLVQLKRNAQGEDIKALESALVGKPVPEKI